MFRIIVQNLLYIIEQRLTFIEKLIIRIEKCRKKKNPHKFINSKFTSDNISKKRFLKTIGINFKNLRAVPSKSI